MTAHFPCLVQALIVNVLGKRKPKQVDFCFTIMSYDGFVSDRLLQKHVERTVITETRRAGGYYRNTSSGRLLQKHVERTVITETHRAH
jgi:hypothetical protein